MLYRFFILKETTGFVLQLWELQERYMIQPIPGGATKLLLFLESNLDEQPAILLFKKNVQKQRGGCECGLYAIANSTSLAYGKDPIKMTYTELAMCEHLIHCLSEMKLELQPHNIMNSFCTFLLLFMSL